MHSISNHHILHLIYTILICQLHVNKTGGKTLDFFFINVIALSNFCMPTNTNQLGSQQEDVKWFCYTCITTYTKWIKPLQQLPLLRETKSRLCGLASTALLQIGLGLSSSLPHSPWLLMLRSHCPSFSSFQMPSFPHFRASIYYTRRRQWHPTPVLLPGKSHGRRSLVGCSTWGREESDRTERLHFHFSLSCIGEGHGNPLQCSCLENPRDGGAW